MKWQGSRDKVTKSRDILSTAVRVCYTGRGRKTSLPGKPKRKTPGFGAEPRFRSCTLTKEEKGNPTSSMQLPRKQTMVKKKWGFLTHVMVSLTHFRQERKGELIIIVAQEILPCPLCGGELYTRSTCHRRAINASGNTDHYRLRVLQCRGCRKTHRELPTPLVPYKRYDSEAITEIAGHPESAPCNSRTIDLIRRWLEWFVSYARHVQESLRLQIRLPEKVGKSACEEFMALVRIVVNSGYWSHNRTEFSCSQRSAILCMTSTERS